MDNVENSNKDEKSRHTSLKQQHDQDICLLSPSCSKTIKKVATSEIELPEYYFEEHEGNSIVPGQAALLCILEGLICNEDISETSFKMSEDLIKWCKTFDVIKIRNLFLQHDKVKRDKGLNLDMILKAVDNSFRKQERLENNKKSLLGYSCTSEVQSKLKTVIEKDSVFNVASSKDYLNKKCNRCSAYFHVEDDDEQSEDCRLIDYNTTSLSLSKLFLYLSQSKYHNISNLMVIGAGDGAYVFGAFIFSNANRIIASETDDYWLNWLRNSSDKYNMSKLDIVETLLPIEKLKKCDTIILTETTVTKFSEDEWLSFIENLPLKCLIVSSVPIDRLLSDKVKQSWEAKIQLVDRVDIGIHQLCQSYSTTQELITGHIIYRGH